jgi:hypothetical protein
MNRPLQHCFGVIMLGWSGCATPPQTTPDVGAAPGAAAPVATQSRAFSQPTVLGDMPERPLLDLGPVLVDSKSAAWDVTRELAIQAARLNADAFVLERREYILVYAVKNARWRERHPTLGNIAEVVVAVSRMLLVSTWPHEEQPMSGREKGFYRAIRYVPDIPPARASDLIPVSAGLKEAFAESTNLQDQLLLAHALFGTQELSRREYEKVRCDLAELTLCN